MRCFEPFPVTTTKSSSKSKINKKIIIKEYLKDHRVFMTSRKLKISRIALRQLGLQGKIPGLVKSSW